MPNIFTAIYHSYLAHAAIVAVKLGIPEHLKDRPRTLEEICQETNCHENSLRHILKILCTYDFLEQKDDGKFYLTNNSKQLMTVGDESFIKDYILYVGDQILPAFAHLEEMARTDVPAFTLAHGMPLWDLCRTDRQKGTVFENHMNSAARWHARFVAKALDCSSFRKLVDVGGGHASLASALLKANEHLSAVILDQPHLAGRAAERLRSEGLSDRCEFVGGDFFKEVVPGGDLYTIKHVLHDWKNEDVIRILRNIHAAMPPTARLVIIEGVMEDEKKDPDWMGARNLEQFVTTGGYQRTKLEFSDLLEAAGFKLDRILPTPVGDCSLIFAVPR